MLDSLFDNKSAKRFDKIAKEKAKIHEKELEAAKDFMRVTSRDTIQNVFDMTEKSGHPEEIELSHQIREKYNGGQNLEFDDIMTLEALYKSNYRVYYNKGGLDG